MAQMRPRIEAHGNGLRELWFTSDQIDRKAGWNEHVFRGF